MPCRSIHNASQTIRFGPIIYLKYTSRAGWWAWLGTFQPNVKKANNYGSRNSARNYMTRTTWWSVLVSDAPAATSIEHTSWWPLHAAMCNAVCDLHSAYTQLRCYIHMYTCNCIFRIFSVYKIAGHWDFSSFTWLALLLGRLVLRNSGLDFASRVFASSSCLTFFVFEWEPSSSSSTSPLSRACWTFEHYQ